MKYGEGVNLILPEKITLKKPTIISVELTKLSLNEKQKAIWK